MMEEIIAIFRASQEETKSDPEQTEPKPGIDAVHRGVSGGPQGKSRSEIFWSIEEAA
jgi:hypothetical protein